MFLYYFFITIVLNLERSELNHPKIGNLLVNPDLELFRLDSRQKIIGKFKSPREEASCGENNENCDKNCAEQILSHLKKNEKLPESLHDIHQCKSESWPETLKESLSEGCKVTGRLQINKISGEFHFTPKIELDNQVLRDSPRNCKLDFSHIINELFFGDKIKEADPMKEISVDLSLNDKSNYSYFLKLVPIQLIYRRGDKISGYRVSITRHQKKVPRDNNLPSVNFNYDFSAMTICKTQKRKPFTSFMTGLCAIVGGIYTIAALTDSLLFRAQRTLFTKTQTGKYF
jgi:hypothetical protein